MDKIQTLAGRIVLHLRTPFINPQGAENVRNYNYHGEDHSKIVKYYQPFWNKLATFIPDHVSPNVVTLIGYAIALTGCISVVYYSQSNPWVFALYGVLLFAYQTFDALDGLQGRKVGMYTNATTEVFDHGCDSNVLIMTTVASIYALGIVGTWQSAALLLGTITAFLLLTWENTTTKVMIFRSGVLNPTDSLASTQLFFLATAFFPGLWTTPLHKVLFLSGSIGHGWLNALLSTTLGEVIVYSSLYTAVFAAKISMSAVLDYWKNKHHQTTVAPNVLRDFLKSCVVLSPTVLLSVVGVFWLIIGDSPALKQHPVLSVVTLAVPWAYSIMRLIISEITNQDINISGMALSQIPLLFPLLAKWVPHCAFLEIPAMYLSLACFIPLYAWTTYRTVGDTCSALNMAHFWTIPPQKPKSAEKGKNGISEKSAKNDKSDLARRKVARTAAE